MLKAHLILILNVSNFLTVIDEYRINFIAEDIDYCQENYADTIQLVIEFNIEDNTDPIINNVTEYELTTNKPFEIDINASDSDNDLILLELISMAILGDLNLSLLQEW